MEQFMAANVSVLAMAAGAAHAQAQGDDSGKLEEVQNTTIAITVVAASQEGATCI